MKLKTALQQCETAFRNGVEIITIMLTISLGALIFDLSALAIVVAVFALINSIFVLFDYQGIGYWKELKEHGFNEDDDIEYCIRTYRKTESSKKDKNAAKR